MCKLENEISLCTPEKANNSLLVFRNVLFALSTFSRGVP